MPTTTPPPAPLSRRLLASLYEFCLLFGLIIASALVIQTLLSVLSLTLPYWVHSILFFIIIGAYFVYCWTHGGQTLAQRTWHIQVVNAQYARVSTPRAWLRYVLSYLGVWPALFIVWRQMHHAATWSVSWLLVLVLGLGLINWLALLGTALLHPHRAALHERGSGTRSVWLR